MDEKNIYKNLHEELNKRFGTVLPWEDNNILTLEAFQTCFDIYDTKESFEENTEMTFEELLGDTSTLIDGHYIFFNDCNYDWSKGMITGDFITIEEQQELRNLQIKQGLLSDKEIAESQETYEI